MASTTRVITKTVASERITDAMQILQNAITVSEDPGSNPFALLACALLFSGRRVSEILFQGGFSECKSAQSQKTHKAHKKSSKRSKSKDSNKNACRFEGDARNKLVKAYDIPLLVDFDSFMSLVQRIHDAIPIESKEQINAKYSHQISDSVKEFMGSVTATTSDLRRLYAALSFTCFDHGVPFDAWSLVIGHGRLETSIHAKPFAVDGLEHLESCLGAWKVAY